MIYDCDIRHLILSLISLISTDLIDQISDGSALGQKLVDFGLPRGHLSDENATA